MIIVERIIAILALLGVVLLILGWWQTKSENPDDAFGSIIPTVAGMALCAAAVIATIALGLWRLFFG